MPSPLSLSCQPDTDECLRDRFGLSGFRPGQRAIIDTMLAGDNVLAVMPTGAGKSLCYQLPAVVCPGFTVVVSPLIALMENQVAQLRDAGVGAGMIHSSRDRDLNIADWKAVAEGKSDLLYMAPERLLTGRMIGALKKLPVNRFVIDEAHCVAQWGHGFRADYLGLSRLRELFPDVPLAAFTATADVETREDIVERLFGGVATSFVEGFDRPNIAIRVVEKKKMDKQLISLLKRRRGQSGIVYCRSRKGAEATAQLLRDQRFKAVAYHAGLADDERSGVLDDFLNSPGLIVCATIAFGMGIDKPDIRYVIHRDLPQSLEAYYQEIGRAGRDGKPADAILLYGYGDLIARRKMIDLGSDEENSKRRQRGRLDALVDFCEMEECRRNVLLSYFGEDRTDDCGRCDVCK